jgi:predicted nucleic acid-binding protein
MRFIDTNIALYSIGIDPKNERKRAIARNILRNGNFVLSTQVLQEFYVQATGRKFNEFIDEETVRQILDRLLIETVVETTKGIVLQAVEIKQRNQISYWDAAIIAAAQVAGCDVVLTEDMNHGQKFGNVRIENPFLQF